VARATKLSSVSDIQIPEDVGNLDQLIINVILKPRIAEQAGASAFRLQQKKATSGQGRGTANIFVSSERFDDTRPDSVINMLSDISHLIKKAVTILHTSSPTSKSRFLKIPDYLVQMVFRTRPFPGAGHHTACRAPPQDLEARRGHLSHHGRGADPLSYGGAPLGGSPLHYVLARPARGGHRHEPPQVGSDFTLVVVRARPGR
jgi:hypothetical protein